MNRASGNKISFKWVLLLFILSVGNKSNAQIITSLGGNGSSGYNGEGTATASQLYAPQGVAVTGNGYIYVADGMNNRIRLITPSGIISTIAGGDDPGNTGDNGPATDAMLNGPAGVATDNQGNLYIADKYNNRVRKIAPNGNISAFAGTSEKGYSGNGGPATNAQLDGPVGLTVDSVGNVFIADAGNHCIRKVTQAGKISTIAGSGVAGYFGDGGNATNAQLNTPSGVAVDTAGNVYIADAWNYRIRKVTPSGTISTVVGTGVAGYGGDGNDDTLGLLNLPTGVAVDRTGNLFIADQGNNRIRIVSPAGIINTLAGDGTAGYSGDGGNAWLGELNAPYGIVTDGRNNVYVAEQQSNRIRRITVPPTPKVVKKKPDDVKSKPLPPYGSGTPIIQTPAPNTGYQYSPGSTARHKNGG
jgi:sugar lactone lactonase YvrE